MGSKVVHTHIMRNQDFVRLIEIDFIILDSDSVAIWQTSHQYPVVMSADESDTFYEWRGKQRNYGLKHTKSLRYVCATGTRDMSRLIPHTMYVCSMTGMPHANDKVPSSFIHIYSLRLFSHIHMFWTDRRFCHRQNAYLILAANIQASHHICFTSHMLYDYPTRDYLFPSWFCLHRLYLRK